MKNPKRLTKAQKDFLRQQKLDPKNWYVIKNTPIMFEVISIQSLRKSKKTKCFNKKAFNIKF